MTTTMRDRFYKEFYKNNDALFDREGNNVSRQMEDFIEQELKKEREEIIEWIEKQDWECFEQTFITKDIINTIKNRV